MFVCVVDYAPKSHAIETMVVYLLNVQEWAFLSDLDVRGAKEAMDYKEVRTEAVGNQRNSQRCQYPPPPRLLQDYKHQISAVPVEYSALLSPINSAVLSSINSSLFSPINSALLSSINSSLFSQINSALLSSINSALFSPINSALYSVQ